VRVLIFHGYLLDGTGSNVYNARLAAALRRLGHDVHLLCQERHPEALPFVDAAGDWDGGALEVRILERTTRAPGSCTVYRPDIGGLLPVYVADRYEGVEARTFADCSDVEVSRYLDANATAVAQVAAAVHPDAALANHLVMGPAVLARGLGGATPYAAKIHGSALEYTVKPEPERFLPYARVGLEGARGVLVGSRHTALSLWRALDLDGLEARTRLGPPGVDVELFAPRPAAEAAAGVRVLAAGLRAREGSVGGSSPQEQSAFARDPGAAGEALARLDPERGPVVAYVGKLIVSKGVDLLLAAWPLVLDREPRAQLAVVGFGAYRAALERLLGALAAGDLAEARAIAIAGRRLESADAERRPLRHLLAFLDSLSGAELAAYRDSARALRERVVFTGRLQHDELAELLPACAAVVVPSTFPEAFGMVAAEAAACGTLPICAAHSGLAEVAEELARRTPPAAAEWLSFPVDDLVVRAIAERVSSWLEADGELRAATRAGLVAAVGELWSWEGVARGVLAAARGDLDGLRAP
jgi:glycosyltransferase involved in cell wall biosynthesis